MIKRPGLLVALYACLCLSSGRLVVAQSEPRLVHVFVALADNKYQGIVPVPASLGNGDDAAHNLYWGAAFGVRTFFHHNAEWQELATTENPSAYVLERTVFRHAATGTILIADAYRGREIKRAILDFYRSAAGFPREEIKLRTKENKESLSLPQADSLSVYVGQDGLMDFSIERDFDAVGKGHRETIILACASKAFFAPKLRATGAEPVLWTTGLMAPEAYTLKAALDGWMIDESREQIRQRAAAAYSHYQKCSLSAAQRLFSSSW